MNLRLYSLVLAYGLVYCLPVPAAELTLVAGPIALPVSVADAYDRLQLTLELPDGSTYERDYTAADGRTLALGLPALADGRYRYRLQPQWRRGSSDGGGERTPVGAALASIEGSFAVQGGRLALPGPASRRDAPQAKDQVIPDDLIVQGSTCAGLDCVNNEAFNFDTLRLKENNLRIAFNDTSTGTFPAVDWQLTANDSADGGVDRFSIEDITNARVPFTVRANAPSNSLYLAASGNLGLGTANPTLDLQIATGDTPALRLEQNSSSGFTAQTWDVAGNEAGFFIRDVTGGSRLSFRIRPGAPTSSLDIAASGRMGIGTAAPQARLDVAFDAPLGAAPVAALRVSNADASVPADQRDRFLVDSAGNVTARGSIAQLSSRAAKQDFEALDSRLLLARLEQMPVQRWRYRDAPEQQRHIGPVAEDFHAAFEVGADPRYLAPADVAGVALASVKALQVELGERDRRISELEARLAALEARLAASAR